MPDESKRAVITDQNVQDMIDTAAYGGITYWATNPSAKNFDSAPEGTVATIKDSEDGQVFHLSADQVRDAYLALLDLDQKLVGREIHGYVIDSWRDRDADGIECGRIDASAADCIVQVACFGEVIYG